MIGAVVCTKDRPDDLTRCIASLIAQSAPAARIVVVDAGTQLPDLPPEVEVVRSEPGLPHQRNVALGLLDTELVAFFDDDVILEREYLERVQAWFVERPACAGVSGDITNDLPMGRASSAYRTVFSLGQADGRLRPSGDGIYLYHPSTPTRVDFVSGSNMVWRRSAIEGLRFDERLAGYAYMEDVDFSLLASARGELWMLPDAKLEHRKSTTSRIPTRSYVTQVFSNGAYLFAKHQPGHDLRRLAYTRRVVGRAAGYMAVAAKSRSLEPVRGVVDGLRQIPRQLQAGREGTART